MSRYKIVPKEQGHLVEEGNYPESLRGTFPTREAAEQYIAMLERPSTPAVFKERRKHNNPSFQNPLTGCLVCAPNSIERRRVPKQFQKGWDALKEAQKAYKEACAEFFGAVHGAKLSVEYWRIIACVSYCELSNGEVYE